MGWGGDKIGTCGLDDTDDVKAIRLINRQILFQPLKEKKEKLFFSFDLPVRKKKGGKSKYM